MYALNMGVFKNEDIVGLQVDEQSYEMLVHWKGLELSDSTWKNIQKSMRGCP